jgi:hypothetical protein
MGKTLLRLGVRMSRGELLLIPASSSKQRVHVRSWFIDTSTRLMLIGRCAMSAGMAQTTIVGAEDHVRLATIIGDRNRPQKHAQRANLILLSAERLPMIEVARRRASAGRRRGAGRRATPSAASTGCCSTSGNPGPGPAACCDRVQCPRPDLLGTARCDDPLERVGDARGHRHQPARRTHLARQPPPAPATSGRSSGRTAGSWRPS